MYVEHFMKLREVRNSNYNVFVDNEYLLPYQMSDDESESSRWWEKNWRNRQKAVQGSYANKWKLQKALEVSNDYCSTHLGFFTPLLVKL